MVAKSKSPLDKFRKRFQKWTPIQQAEWVASLSPAAALALRYETDFWLRDKQIVSGNDWMFWLILAGRGFGKTRAGASWLHKCIAKHRPLAGRHDLYALCGPTHKDVSQVMVPAIVALYPDAQKPDYKETKGQLVFHNGAIAYCYSSETEIRGPNIEKSWCDEIAKWYSPDAQFETMANAVRIGVPQVLCTTTGKKSIKTLRQLIQQASEGSPDVRVVQGSTQENVHLNATFIKRLSLAEGTRRYRQEIMGELLNDTEDALFTEENIQANRAFPDPSQQLVNLPVLANGEHIIHIVVAIDPAGTANPESDETGIVVCGLSNKGHAYVLEDASGRMMPEQWARRAVDLFNRYKANWIIGEKNFGGDMVEATVRSIDRGVPFKGTTASHGKFVRAEKVSVKYAQNLVHHVGSAARFEKLEDQMTSFTGQPSTKAKKDDRLDALVWALNYLLCNERPVYRNITNLPRF